MEYSMTAYAVQYSAVYTIQLVYSMIYNKFTQYIKYKYGIVYKALYNQFNKVDILPHM